MPAAVLIVDDDPDVRELLAAVLVDHGYEAWCVADGREALALLGERTPSLALLDLMMPVMNGWDLFAAMREQPRLAAIPVIFVSANAELCPTGAAAVLRKPIELTALLAALGEVIAARGG